MRGSGYTVPNPASAAFSHVRSYRHDDRACLVVDADPFNNGARQPTRPLPYSVVLHPVLLPLVSSR
jgi:hypothetical protein